MSRIRDRASITLRRLFLSLMLVAVANSLFNRLLDLVRSLLAAMASVTRLVCLPEHLDNFFSLSI